MKRAKNAADLGRKLGMPYQRVLRAIRKGLIAPDGRGGFAIEHSRTQILSHAATVSARLSLPEKRALLKVRIRKMRAEADILESKVKQQSGGEQVFPASQIRRAWRACELHWVEQLQTIARQLGARFGGKMGKEVEGFATQLHREMFARMAADPILRGPNAGPSDPGVRT